MRQIGRAPRDGDILQGVQLDVETSDAAALLYGFRSSRLLIDVDCAQRRNRVLKSETFQQSSLGGPATDKTVTGGWAVHSAGSYMTDVIIALCRPTQPPATTPAAAPAPPPAKLALAKPPADKLRPAAALPVTPSLAPPPKAAVASVAVRPAPKPIAKPVLATPQAAADGITVQVAASDSLPQAEHALTLLRPRLADGLKGATNRAEVRGRVFYRATISGFRTPAEARTFCQQVEGGGGQCWLRP